MDPRRVLRRLQVCVGGDSLATMTVLQRIRDGIVKLSSLSEVHYRHGNLQSEKTSMMIEPLFSAA
jgi:hypothetical protein